MLPAPSPKGANPRALGSWRSSPEPAGSPILAILAKSANSSPLGLALLGMNGIRRRQARSAGPAGSTP